MTEGDGTNDWSIRISDQIADLKALTTENLDQVTDQHLEQIRLLMDEMERVVNGQAAR